MHAFDVTQVVDRCEHHVGLALKASTGHQVVECGPPFGQFCAANGLRRRLNGGFACHAQAVQNRGPSALFLEFSNAFFNLVGGTRNLHLNVASEDTDNCFSHVWFSFACIVKHWRSPVALQNGETPPFLHAMMR